MSFIKIQTDTYARTINMDTLFGANNQFCTHRHLARQTWIPTPLNWSYTSDAYLAQFVFDGLVARLGDLTLLYFN